MLLNKIKSIAIIKKVIRTRIYFYVRDIKTIKNTLKSFNHESNDKEIIRDMIDEKRLHKVPYDEYFLFDFDKCKDRKYRDSFVTDIERVEIANLLNNPQNEAIFYDKEKTYEKFGNYYLRDVLRIDSKEKYDDFLVFTKKHNAFICKPIDGGCGVGIKIINNVYKNSVKKLFNDILDDYNCKCIIEELIIQREDIKQLHPQSVNTVRMPTVYYSNEKIEVVHPFFRVGQGNSITDNAGSGGIICALDVNSGIVIATADEFGHKFAKHPDTGIELIGFKLPQWDQAVKLVQKLAKKVPDNRYCSWDLALTDKGWDLVEVNARGQFVWQYATKLGFKQEIESILAELGVK